VAILTKAASNVRRKAAERKLVCALSLYIAIRSFGGVSRAGAQKRSIGAKRNSPQTDFGGIRLMRSGVYLGMF